MKRKKPKSPIRFVTQADGSKNLVDLNAVMNEIRRERISNPDTTIVKVNKPPKETPIKNPKLDTAVVLLEIYSKLKKMNIASLRRVLRFIESMK